LQAADDATVEQLKAEIARLKEIIAKQAASATEAPVTDAIPNPAKAENKNKVAEPVATEEPTTLDAVVIRSRNRIELLKDVPLSVSVVPGAELDRLGAAD